MAGRGVTRVCPAGADCWIIIIIVIIIIIIIIIPHLGGAGLNDDFGRRLPWYHGAYHLVHHLVKSSLLYCLTIIIIIYYQCQYL